MTGGWRKLRNEDLRDLYTSPSMINKVKQVEMGGACSTNWGQNERIWVTGTKARRKETARKTKM
jgi:hypothetical protein